MHEIQALIDHKKPENYISDTAKKLKGWHTDHFDWATQYIYGVEKDYRLVKVGKVGCYLHGDGLANVILSDGLAKFDHPEYKLKLKNQDSAFPKENKQFYILVSNPPYSIPAFRNVAKDYYTEKDFELYDNLTDNSKEIECLFVERAKQLLKDGGVAGIILPKSILSSVGLYAKTRSIILHNFELIAVVEMDSNTFMATTTKTAVLFLRRKNNYDSINLKKSIDKFFIDWQDVTRNGVEKPIMKYVAKIWKNVNFEDYVSLLKKEPNSIINNHEIYCEYREKIKAKTEKDFWNTLIETEKEKLLYFILAYPQKTVWIKTGEKEAEKRFIGYEFSDRRGHEGIHAIERNRSIAECTKLFDENTFDNPEKASTYIYKAFSGIHDFSIHENLKDNIKIYKTTELFNFKSVNFEHIIETPKDDDIPDITTKWQLKNLFPDTVNIIRGVTYSKNQQVEKSNIIILTADNITLDGKFKITKQVFLNNDLSIEENKKLLKDDIFMCFSSGSRKHLGKVALIEENTQYYAGGFMAILRVREGIESKYLYYLLNGLLRQTVIQKGTGANINNLSSVINDIKIPHPPIDIQQKIVSEIEILEEKAKTVVVPDFDGEIEQILKKYL
ncbi:MAG: N-6 DNA methylase, partial [Tannerella sp.]|jgi:type I restriction enzyme M protein|nr:N-6 DNA methylase [Tannerella sp.]